MCFLKIDAEIFRQKNLPNTQTPTKKFCQNFFCVWQKTWSEFLYSTKKTLYLFKKSVCLFYYSYRHIKNFILYTEKKNVDIYFYTQRFIRQNLHASNNSKNTIERVLCLLSKVHVYILKYRHT